MDETFYDILSGKPDKNPCWRASVKGLENARQRMEQFASESPGDYFIYNAKTQQVVARLDYRPNQSKVASKADNAAQAKPN